ncbi:MAG: chitobiase/beta-hexosaminidase C-terminal domain-containing protein [Paludibacteraceae bacterium]|nr:chitobiase/beta-hexosaminidase C-terminal domain-containing protein [Paludibacteraceae bacterium]
MKKILSLLTLALLSCFTALAADSDNVLIKTVDFTSDAWASCRTAGQIAKNATVDGCTATANLSITADGEMNFNGSNMSTAGGNALEIPLENVNGSVKIVITSTSASVRFNWFVAEGDADCTNRNATAAGVTTVNYTFSSTATTGTLFIGRRGSSDQIAITKIQVYTADASSVADPTISFSSPNVTITCPTAGAAIYYTLDGTDPTNTSTLYTASFSIAEDKVVKAIAYKNAINSNVVSKYCGLDKTFSTTTLVRFDDGNFATPASATIEGIIFGSGVSYTEGSASAEGETFTAGIQFDGGSWNANRYMSFKVAGACKVYIYGMSNSTGDIRYIDVKQGDKPTEGGQGIAVGKNVAGYMDVSLFNCTAASNTTIWLTPRDGKNYRVFAIKIVFGNENSYTATIGSTGYATLALPYAVSIPTGVTAYTGALNGAGDAVTLTQITNGIIPANTGVVINGEAGNYTFNETTSAGSAVTNLGNTAGEGLDISSDANSYYVLAKDGDDAVFALVDNATYKVIPANKAYVNVPSGSAPSLRIIGAINGATNIMNMDNIENAIKYIEGGNLYIKKNGVTYNAVGAVVK